MPAVAAAMMLAAAMVAAFMIAMMVFAVVIAFRLRIVVKRVAEQRFNSSVRAALHAAKKTDARLSQRHLRAAANTTADQYIHIQPLKHTCQSAMAAAIGIDHHAHDHFAILRIVDLEGFRMTEVLENLAIVIRHCNSHDRSSLFGFTFVLSAHPDTHFIAACAVSTVTKAVISAFNAQSAALHNDLRNLPASVCIHLLHRRSGHFHLLRAFLLRKTTIIDQADALILIHRQRHFVYLRLRTTRNELRSKGKRTNPSAFSGPGHISASFRRNMRTGISAFLTLIILHF